MFPPSLHKNIEELNKQICILETECENMETGKKKDRLGAKPSCPKGSKASSKANLKPPPVKQLSKGPFVTGPSRSSNTGMARINKPPILPKMHSTSSVPSKNATKLGDKDTSPTTEIGLQQISRRNSRSDLHPCSSCTTNSREKSPPSVRREKTLHGCVSCVCGRQEAPAISANFIKDIEVHKEISKQEEPEKLILHREVVYTNPGSAIEVTVRTKPSSTDDSNLNGISCKRSISLIKEISETSSDQSDSHPGSKKGGRLDNKSSKESYHREEAKHQKWSEILQESDPDVTLKERKRRLKSEAKFQGAKSNNSLTSQTPSKAQCCRSKTCPPCQAKQSEGESVNRHSGCFKEDQRIQGQILREKYVFDGQASKTAVSPSKKNRQQTTKSTKRKTESDIETETKNSQEIQCQIWNEEPKKPELPLDLYNPIRTLYFLMNELKDKIIDIEQRKLLSEMGCALQKIYSDKKTSSYNSSIHPFHAHNTHNKEKDLDPFADRDNEYVAHLRKSYDNCKNLVANLIKEKEKLSNELTNKEKLITSMKNKERDQLSLIYSLNHNLEKTKLQAEDSVRILEELNTVKSKLVEETKIADGLRKSHKKMQEHVQKCLLENDKLKTQIRMSKLEAQKFSVLLAGKDMEIKRYKEEVESFQKQISEQLAILRSSAAVNEVEQAMEAIIHHSHNFSQTDLDSAFSETKLETTLRNASTPTHTKSRTKLAHSSPTTTSTSANSSWNQISSIHPDEPEKDVIVLSSIMDPDLKESIEIFGIQDNSGYEAGSSKHSRDSRQFNGEEEKKGSSFTSCKSVTESKNSSITHDRNDSSAFIGHRKTNLSYDTDLRESDECKAAVAAIAQKIRHNIEEMFQDVKFRCTERLHLSPPDDWFGVSPLSDLSTISENLSINLSDVSDRKDSRKKP